MTYPEPGPQQPTPPYGGAPQPGGVPPYGAGSPYSSPGSPYAAPLPYGVTPEQRTRRSRTPLEVAHLVAAIACPVVYLVVLVAKSLLLTRSAFFLIPFVFSTILSPVLWVLVAALVQACRRRPSATAATACVLSVVPFLLLVLQPRPVMDTSVGPADVIWIVLILGSTGLSLAANRQYDGRPAGVTLAQGLCLATLLRFIMSIPAMAAGAVTGGDSSSPMRVGPWMQTTNLDAIASQALGTGLYIVLAVLAVVGVTTFFARRTPRAWMRLAAASVTTALVYVVLAVLPRSGSAAMGGRLVRGTLDIYVLSPCVLAMGLVVLLPSVRRWYSPAPGQESDWRSATGATATQ